MSDATARSGSKAASAGALKRSCIQQFIVAYDTIDGQGWARPVVDKTRASSPRNMATVHSKERL